MPLPDLRGHDEVRRLLARTVLQGNLPQSVLLHGPEGVGKERLGLWLAQLLVCENPSAAEGPCGACSPCRLALRLEHPDVHWYFPLPRPERAGSPDKLRQKLEESRHAELARRRAHPHQPPEYDRAPAHFLAAVLNLQQQAAVRPHLRGPQVFVVGDAEAMVPQESSPEAANAFLKLLEEPPPDTVVIITSSQPGALLPTIRSRVLPVRVLPLPDAEVAAWLRDEELAEGEVAERVATLAGGAPGRALRLLPGGDGKATLEEHRQSARTLLIAVLTDGATARYAAAHDEKPTGGRGEFQNLLDGFGSWLRDLLAVASGAEEQVVNRDGLDLLRRAVERFAPHPLGIAAALARVDEARELASGNVNPQLVLADLLHRVQADLRPDQAA